MNLRGFQQNKRDFNTVDGISAELSGFPQSEWDFNIVDGIYAD
jgi:hypothetical protein